MKRGKIRAGKNDLSENTLLEWFQQVSTLNLAINDFVLMEKVNEIAKSKYNVFWQI